MVPLSRNYIPLAGRAIPNNCCNRRLSTFHRNFTSALNTSGLCPLLIDLIRRVILLVPAVIVYPILGVAVLTSRRVQPNLPARVVNPGVVFNPPAQGQGPVLNLPPPQVGSANLAILANTFVDQAVANLKMPCFIFANLEYQGQKINYPPILIPSPNHAGAELNRLKAFLNANYKSNGWELNLYHAFLDNDITIGVDTLDRGATNQIDTSGSTSALSNPTDLNKLTAYDDLFELQLMLPSDWFEQLQKAKIDLSTQSQTTALVAPQPALPITPTIPQLKPPFEEINKWSGYSTPYSLFSLLSQPLTTPMYISIAFETPEFNFSAPVRLFENEVVFEEFCKELRDSLATKFKTGNSWNLKFVYTYCDGRKNPNFDIKYIEFIDGKPKSITFTSMQAATSTYAAPIVRDFPANLPDHWKEELLNATVLFPQPSRFSKPSSKAIVEVETAMQVPFERHAVRATFYLKFGNEPRKQIFAFNAWTSARESSTLYSRIFRSLRHNIYQKCKQNSDYDPEKSQFSIEFDLCRITPDFSSKEITYTLHRVNAPSLSNIPDKSNLTRQQLEEELNGPSGVSGNPQEALEVQALLKNLDDLQKAKQNENQ